LDEVALSIFFQSPFPYSMQTNLSTYDSISLNLIIKNQLLELIATSFASFGSTQQNPLILSSVYHSFISNVLRGARRKESSKSLKTYTQKLK
jgi:hypothetical protein